MRQMQKKAKATGLKCIICGSRITSRFYARCQPITIKKMKIFLKKAIQKKTAAHAVGDDAYTKRHCSGTLLMGHRLKEKFTYEKVTNWRYRSL
jgi:hypothetical protein